MVVRAPAAHDGTMQARPLQGPAGAPGHTLGVPVPPGRKLEPQVSPPGQALPQSMVPPQPSPILPQYCPPPAGVQVSFLQPGSPQTPGWVPPAAPPQIAGAAQVPQSRVPPQPSPTTPQNREPPALQVRGTQPAPATHNPEALQIWGKSQPPQSMARPHPSPTRPQYLPVAT